MNAPIQQAQHDEKIAPDDHNAEELHAAETAFRRQYPAYAQTSALDDLRTRDYARLDAQGQIYLDYTGGSLYAESQLQAHFDLLRGHVLGNPHSHNPTSLAATEMMDRAREYVLRYFNASPDEYVAIFTSNASGALKLVGESYPFVPGSRYLLIADNHNSVNGIREFARARGAAVDYLPVYAPDLRPNQAELSVYLARAAPKRLPGSANLFAYPAQSNFSGVQHSLEWIDLARSFGWDVLVDCAAFVPTNRLDLSRVRPDFVSLSFYKIFGYPTGVGCLIAAKAALAKLRRPWFAGGTITIASTQGEGWHVMRDDYAAFEDGTVNYLGLPAVEIGLRHIESIGIETIHARVQALTAWLLQEMSALHHANGKALVQIYGPTTPEQRGGTIAFNLFDAEGRFFEGREVEAPAHQSGISLRSGCFCNPGAGEAALGITREQLEQCFRPGLRMTYEQLLAYMQGTHEKDTSALRISVGLVSNFADVFRFITFLRRFLDRQASAR